MMRRLVLLGLVLVAAGFLTGLSVNSAALCFAGCRKNDQTLIASGVIVERIDDSNGEIVEMPEQIALLANVYGAPQTLYVGDLTFTVRP